MSEVYVLFQDQLVPKDQVSIDMEDRGYNFGDGIYEVVYVYNGKPFALDEHFERFESSAAKLEMKLPYSVSKFVRLTELLIEKNHLENGIVYIQMTRGISPRNHLFEREAACLVTGFSRKMEPPAALQQNGISVYITPDIRWLRCDIKSLNLLGNTMAKREAADHNCHEAILHRNGVFTEGSSSNLFIVKNGILKTHPATNLILNGITRQKILELAAELNISVAEEPFDIKEFIQADEVFISSTTMEVTPVIHAFGEQQVSFEKGAVTQNLQKALKEKILETSALGQL